MKRALAGLGLTEVLVTLALLGFMLSALGRLQALARYHHDLGRQQGMAIVLAQARLAALRQTLASGTVPGGGSDSLGLGGAIPLAGADARYLRQWRLAPPAAPGGPWRLRVEVSWHGPHNQPKSVILYSLARGADPLAEALLYAAPPPVLAPPKVDGRH